MGPITTIFRVGFGSARLCARLRGGQRCARINQRCGPHGHHGGQNFGL